MAKKNRNEKGQFLPGNQEGVKFTSENQPSNSGRKPSRFKKIISELEEQTGESMSSEDLGRMIRFLLSATTDELNEILEKPTTPIAIHIIVSSILSDMENQELTNFDKLMDRVFGKSTQKIDIPEGTNIGCSGNIVENHTVIFKNYKEDK